MTSEQYEYFYQGSCAELYVSSLFYFAGYEASKVIPDAGIDLVVSNITRSRFVSNEQPRRCEIQVKSTLLDEKGASFAINEEELMFLCQQPDRYTVFVLFYGLTGGDDPGSFDFYADFVDKAIDRDIAQYKEALMEERGRKLRNQGLASFFDFGQAKLKAFWLNSAQMKRCLDEGVWRREANSDRYRLQVDLDDGAIKLKDIYLIPELTDVRYIMRDCKAAQKIRDGMFSYCHL